MSIKFNIRRSALLSIAIGLAAGLIMALGRLSPDKVEAYYSNGLYPVIAMGLSSISAMMPFSCTQLTVVAFLVAVIYAFVKRGVGCGLGVLSLIYASFVGLWGLNYNRPTFETRFTLTSVLDDASRTRILTDLAHRSNATRRTLITTRLALGEFNDVPEAQDTAIASLQASVFTRLGLRAVTTGRVKSLYPGDIMQRLGYSGLFWPWTGEPNINSPIAPGQLAMTIAHERAHLSGFASETDANVLGFITTWSSRSLAVQYSGLLSFWRYVRDREIPLQNEVWTDMRDVDDFWSQGANKTASAAAKKTYDSYLKANGERKGNRSYAFAVEITLKYLDKFGYPHTENELH